jgi:hypothetical protein
MAGLNSGCTFLAEIFMVLAIAAKIAGLHLFSTIVLKA